jgi:hypothetical protein
MKVITLATGTLTVLFVSLPSFAAHAKHAKHVVHAQPQQHAANAVHATAIHATAMHTTQVHSRDASVTHHPAPPAHDVKADAKKKQPAPCLHEPITIGRGTEEEHFSLTRCDGSPLPDAVDHLSVLARADSAMKPMHGGPLPAGMHRIDAKLVERLQLVADHFGHGHAVSMHIISGFRPASTGSYHATAQALDFRVDNVRNEELVQFCKTMQDTGCGYYPNSSFIHMDVRAPGTGHVAWIDASGPGESPHYVSAWPPPPENKSFDKVGSAIPVLGSHDIADSLDAIDKEISALEKTALR